jgi:hypothetical protein
VPRRRRQQKRRLQPAGEDGALFLDGDGVSPMLDGDDVYDNVFLARGAWQLVRADTWRHPWREEMWPPEGAIVYDGITADARRYRPGLGPHDGWLEKVRAAVEADIASVERFRQNNPEAAAEVADELDEYVDDLRGLLALAGSRPPATSQFSGGEFSVAWSKFQMPAQRHKVKW